MVDEKLFNDAIQIASLWLANSKAESTEEYRRQVEGSVQSIYNGLIAVRDRLATGKA